MMAARRFAEGELRWRGEEGVGTEERVLRAGRVMPVIGSGVGKLRPEERTSTAAHEAAREESRQWQANDFMVLQM